MYTHTYLSVMYIDLVGIFIGELYHFCTVIAVFNILLIIARMFKNMHVQLI